MSNEGISQGALRSGSITRTGYSLTTIALTIGSKEELESILQSRIANAPKELFQDIPLILDVSEIKNLISLDYEALHALCKQYGLFLLGLSGILNEHDAKNLNSRGIPVVNSSRYARIREENFKPRVITKRVEVEVPRIVRDPEPLMLISRNIRSGESIQAPGNTVCVLGSVANGARIIASHNVIVLGDLFGEIYAGSPRDNQDPGYKKAFVYCQGRFAPTFIAICGIYQTADDMEREGLSRITGQEVRGIMTVLHGTKLCYGHSRDFINSYISHTQQDRY